MDAGALADPSGPSSSRRTEAAARPFSLPAAVTAFAPWRRRFLLPQQLQRRRRPLQWQIRPRRSSPPPTGFCCDDRFLTDASPMVAAAGPLIWSQLAPRARFPVAPMRIALRRWLVHGPIGWKMVRAFEFSEFACEKHLLLSV
jgi:hypothetical protein